MRSSFFSPNTARAYEKEALLRGELRFQARGWEFHLLPGALNWGLAARFVGTKKQRLDMRFVLADTIKAFTGPAGSFEVFPHEGGHRVRWARTDINIQAEADAIVVAAESA